MPKATSRAIEPVGMTSIGGRTSSPRRMTAALAVLLLDLGQSRAERLGTQPRTNPSNDTVQAPPWVVAVAVATAGRPVR
jgi:hypothetical protein